MKTPVILLAIGIVAIAGTLLFLNRDEAPPPSAPLVEAERGEVIEPPPATSVLAGTAPRDVAKSPEDPAPESTAVLAPSNEPADPAANSAPRPAFSQAIDTLVSPQASFKQRQAALKQLRDAGELDQAMEALKQGAAEHLTSATYPAALGQAQLQKAGVLSETGGTISEMGILGMQADQNFEAALKLEPANWEAQFFKAVAMSHWPLELNRGNEVVQRLSGLIDQQEILPAQPQFAQTYVVLGDQYQKMGQSDHAAATWQLGAKKFPQDPALQKRVSGL